MQSGILRNSNSESIYRWIFRKKDDLDEIVFFFISRTNANNARYEPLFEFSDNIRIVYFKGFPLKYTDLITLFVYRSFIPKLQHLVKKYKVLHLLSLTKFSFSGIQVLHIDDPLYSVSEGNNLKTWQDSILDKNGIPVLICTNEFSSKWFYQKLTDTRIIIIEQGFYEQTKSKEIIQKEEFVCVYSSPYIHYGSDLHGNHSAWGSNVLIDQVIPKLYEKDPRIKVCLIGELGGNARKALTNYSNWYSCDRVDLLENHEIISNCDVGIYPRTIDHKRSVLKIYTYLGGGIPVVTFDLIDTSVIKQYNLGPVVSNVEDFVASLVELKNSPKLMMFYKNNIEKISYKFLWKNLSIKMKSELLMLKNK